tara:strand:- start:144 stop:374 length:231 start_codon:yes stop_codon:yes gene_type:complete
MRLTNKNTGNSFNLSIKETKDFFDTKNAYGVKINNSEDYIIKDTCKEISSFKFFLLCFGMIALCYTSFLLFLQLNY